MSAQEPSIPPQVVDGHNFDPSTTPRASEQRSRSSLASSRSVSKGGLSEGFRAGLGLQAVARRTLGIILLLVTVFLWTASNFLASYIFADDTYSKPYFVTYVNTSLFAISLLPIFIRIAQRRGFSSMRITMEDFFHDILYKYNLCSSRSKLNDEAGGSDHNPSSDAHLLAEDEVVERLQLSEEIDDALSVRETAVLSLEFCLLWFIANYFVAACLSYTSVASSTILTSTSSIWTLLFGAIFRVEKFSVRKLAGVIASLTGIILISSIDLSSGDNDDNRGNFPHKSRDEIAIGDAMAFFSAVMYGIYAIVMKKRIGNEDRVNMPLFFGMVGFFNVLFLWPGFLVLHFTGVETFELPPTSKIWTIIILNSVSSFVSDYCWAYAMLLTTPLVVTVGLSMTIPLSLIGQMIISKQYSSAVYWLGAAIVLLSFVFINHESQDEESAQTSYRPLNQPSQSEA